MAYDLVKQTHPGAPCAIGLPVVDAAGREGRIIHAIAGTRGVRVKFADRFMPEDCDPAALAYAAPPPAVAFARGAR